MIWDGTKPTAEQLYSSPGMYLVRGITLSHVEYSVKAAGLIHQLYFTVNRETKPRHYITVSCKLILLKILTTVQFLADEKNELGFSSLTVASILN